MIKLPTKSKNSGTATVIETDSIRAPRHASVNATLTTPKIEARPHIKYRSTIRLLSDGIALEILFMNAVGGSRIHGAGVFAGCEQVVYDGNNFSDTKGLENKFGDIPISPQLFSIQFHPFGRTHDDEHRIQ